MATQIYDYAGNRVRDMFSTGPACEVYVWDGGTTEIWPDAEPMGSIVLNMRDPDSTTTKQTNGLGMYEQSSPEFNQTQGIWRVSWQIGFPGSEYDWGGMTKSTIGNCSVESFGLNQDYDVANIAALSWTEGTPSSLGVTRTMNLKWYDPTPANGSSWMWRKTFPNNNDYNEDPSWQPPYGPYQIPANVHWYGERLLLGESTGTVSKVTSSYVYNDGSLTWPLPAEKDFGTSFYLQAPTGDAPFVRINRHLNDYGETPLSYVERTGRHIVTIERHDWDPGTEYIIAGRDYAKDTINVCYYVNPPRAKNSSSTSFIDEVPIILYSDDPADRDQLTVTTGETLTYRFYEDII